LWAGIDKSDADEIVARLIKKYIDRSDVHFPGGNNLLFIVREENENGDTRPDAG